MPDLMPQEADQLLRLMQGIRANFRRFAIARPEPGTVGTDIEPFYGDPFPAEAADCGQPGCRHSQYESADLAVECRSGPEVEFVKIHGPIMSVRRGILQSGTMRRTD